jgi:hypothetical protein
MLLRKVAAVVMAVATEAVTEAVTVAGIFTVAAMAGGISAAGILVAGATSAADRCLARLRGRAFAAVVLSPSITQTPYGH